jgi:hypothetical protein
MIGSVEAVVVSIANPNEAWACGVTAVLAKETAWAGETAAGDKSTTCDGAIRAGIESNTG